MHAQDIPKKKDIFVPAQPQKDSVAKINGLKPDGLKTSLPTLSADTLGISSNLAQQDSTKVDSTKAGDGFLVDIVDYKAKDYVRLSRRENRMYLHDEAEVIYGDMQINAGLIILDNEKNEVYAFGIKDTADAYVQTPIFKQGGNVVEPDSIRFNFDTKKALIYNSRTEQSGFRIKNEVSKRENDSVIYMQNVKFTTSENIEDPEYYFYARKIKFVPKKKIVTGLVNMYIADVPTILGLPFGYFPLTEDRASGFIIPSVAEDNRRGFSLQNGGYYIPVSDFMDLTIIGDYFTNGSFALRPQISYAKRYRFNGFFNLQIESLLESERGFPDFRKTNNYNVSWTHSQDAKASPNSRFSAQVNLGSSDFFTQTNNQRNIGAFLTNTFNSSVSYSRTFPGDPQVNVDVAATHTQNTNTQMIQMSLPNVNASVSRIYPFAPKTGLKKGVIHNVNLQYNFNGQNRISTTEERFLTREMWQDATLGMSHSIPIATNFKIFKYFSASMGTNFEERWVFETFQQRFDPDLENEQGEVIGGVVRDTIAGFDAFRSYNFSTSLGTTVYGTFNFGKDKKIQAIRHVIRPSVSYSINPGFDQYYDEFTRPARNGEEDEVEVVSFSRFDGTPFSPPGREYSSSLGFSISNNLEAKVTDKDTTATEAKKIILLNNLSFSSGYNFSADSLRINPVQVRGGIPIITGKLDINFSAQLDPYALDNNNRRFDRFNIDNGGSLFRLTNASANFGYSFSDKDFKKGGNKESDDDSKERLTDRGFRNGGRPDDLFGRGSDLDGNLFEEDDEKEKEDKLNSEFYNFKIPWTLRLSYNVNYNNSARQNEIGAHSIAFSGDIELSPKWKIGASSGFDLKNLGFTFTSLRFQRDLESWRMSFQWIPFSAQASWNFFIGIKSSVLSDIKYDKRREPDRRL